jgi:leucyl aminopeptidase
VGLGPRKDYSPETLRRAAGSMIGYARRRWKELAVAAPGDLQAACEGLLLASYSFSEYKKPEEDRLSQARLLISAPQALAARKAVERASLYCEAVCLARDLVNRGPSDKTPRSLADLAQTLKSPKTTVTVIDKAKAQELGLGSFLGVARGSAAEPVFLHLVHKPKAPARRKVGLVGKGITFDSGGLSLKPPQSMETMKMDMAGAASVLAVFRVLPRLEVRAEVHGFCAITYNMPGPDAMKPGDVIRAMNGKTIEVLNTDAEGRLVLADALAYATREKLDAIIDLATLTGAVVTALGSKVSGTMGNNPPLMRQLKAASEKTGEAFCELPLVRDYKDQIKSSIADLQNIGKARGEAGSIIGGLFLEEFVDGRPWVHCDIAGTAWNDSPSAYCPSGGTGSMVRTLLEYLSAL